MKLWILRPKYDGDYPADPWTPWYDKCFGMVVRAETAEQARLIAEEEHWDEGPAAWTSEEYSTCEELTADGEAGLIIQDSHMA